ncbi:hypothetical protein D9M70_517110 [compost metagenome]
MITTQLNRNVARAATIVIGSTFGKFALVGTTALEITRASAGVAFSTVRDVASR